MKRSRTAAAISAAIIVLTVAAGCSGGSTLTPQLAPGNPSRSQASAVPSRGVDNIPCNSPQAPSKVYVTEQVANDVKVFNAATLSSATAGAFAGLSAPLGIDVSGDRVYVANSGLQNIAVFSKCGSSIGTLPDPTGSPSGVALDVAGNLYVANPYDGFANGEVRYYQGASGSGISIGDPLMNNPMFVTVDKHSNVFAAGANGSFFHVDWCRYSHSNRCNHAGATWTMTNIPVNNWPTGIRVDANGNLVVSVEGLDITTYAVPTFSVISSYPCPTALCGDFGFNSNGSRLFITGYNGNTAWRVNYPLFGGQQQFAPNFSPNGFTWGAAVWPAPAQGG